MALNISITNKFKEAFESKCFVLMTNAYQTSMARKEIKLDWDENDISAQLHDYIHNDPLRVTWKISTNVESHILKNITRVKGFASKLSRIDFRFTTFSTNNEWEYFFEAKNLKQKDSALKRRYIDTGITNFTSGKYSNGCLIGYLLEGIVNQTIDGINNLLVKDKRNSETLVVKVLKLHTDYYESNHTQIGVLKHLIFDFTGLP